MGKILPIPQSRGSSSADKAVPPRRVPETLPRRFVVSQSPRVLRNFVDGEYRSAGTDSTTDIVDPSTGQVVAKAPVSTGEDVDAAYTAADKAFETWGETTPSERQKALLKFADAVEARAEELIKL